jgi:hypothetical protein
MAIVNVEPIQPHALDDDACYRLDPIPCYVLNVWDRKFRDHRTGYMEIDPANPAQIPDDAAVKDFAEQILKDMRNWDENAKKFFPASEKEQEQ